MGLRVLADTRFMSIVVVLLVAVAAASPAQTRPAPAIPDRDRAIDDSVQQLFDEASHLRLNTGQTLAAVLARRSDDEQAFRLAIASKHQAWRSHRQLRGELEIDTWMPISAFNEILSQIIQQRLKDVPDAPLNAITWSRSNPPAVLATGRYSPLTGPVNGQPGWRHCSPRQVQLAKDAAAVDAGRPCCCRRVAVRCETARS